MSMERDELVRSISIGSAFLQRPDISADQKRAAETKLSKYREQLRELDSKRESPYSPEDRGKADTEIAKIREMLAGANPHRKIGKGIRS